MYPRTLAVRLITAVLSGREPLDQAIAAASGEIPSESRGWLQDVCSGTLRWKGRLDWAIDANALKKKPSGWLRKMLLVASYQLIAQERTQPGAVVSETVSEIKRREGEAPARFANAILRKISEQADQWRALPFPASGSVQEQANWASLPEWYWQKIKAQKGVEWASEFAKSCLERPKLWIRARSAEWHPGAWVSQGPLAGAWEVIERGAIQDKEGFATGEFIVQDLSSQFLVNEISGKVLRHFSKKGDRVRALDLCSAPGGKAVGLQWSGMDTVATDRDEERITLLRQTVQRAAAGIQILSPGVLAAGGQEDPGLFDLVWVDSPCSGSGIIRRHPDVRWLRSEKELAGLAAVQSSLIMQGWERVRPGGYLAFSVCSIFEDEGPRVIARADLKGTVLETWALAPHLAPHGDGFWAALIQKH
ncbi:MAG: hypothetical protein A2X94_01330 [Bdellovibrionales bacterium GWB1_55_8]|nr:MAG: hypothetical protein A2X94_01330 [Bdellovibrionales bacterium GWB1_55_8]